MWEQFDKFLKDQKTVASSFEERKAQKFPTFAFCDSRGYNTKIFVAGTAERYNETTFDVENEVDLYEMCVSDTDCTNPSNWSDASGHMVPTGYNGYCKLYEFYKPYDTGTYAGEILFYQSTKLHSYNVIYQVLQCLPTGRTMFSYLRTARTSHWLLKFLGMRNLHL